MCDKDTWNINENDNQCVKQEMDNHQQLIKRSRFSPHPSVVSPHSHPSHHLDRNVPVLRAITARTSI